MIALIDYGAGNLAPVRGALTAIGAEVCIPATPLELQDASGVIVPGVGHFGATASLDTWRDAIVEAIGNGRSLLGIGLGMQWLFEGSVEAPGCPGLGVLAGMCDRLPDGAVKVPHVGWNTIEITRSSALLDGVASGSHVYFMHSYAAPVTGEAVGVSEHGTKFAAAVERGQISGVQFHPETSGDVGLTVLRNFLARAS